ncbi:hypothetical protein M9Y10_016255 [Tritrichomonas musculus]|uniref:Uncharacterized protein n=1 Tax=Tritrichomonas musculus TaxID=1915356 RepID=A0ABR2HW04_9EUKA
MVFFELPHPSALKKYSSAIFYSNLQNLYKIKIFETKDLLKYGSTNKIQVKVNNNEQPNSRWYTGTRIYRPVWLWVQEKDYIEPEGVRISTLSYDPAEIQVSTIH